MDCILHGRERGRGNNRDKKGKRSKRVREARG
jgi:hypothetical protein